MKRTRIVALVITLFLLLSTAPIYALSDTNALKQGDYIKLGTYNNVPILWRVMGSNENGTYLITDKVISFKAFSGMGTVDNRDKAIWAKTVYDGATDRKVWGDPRWEYSSLRVWLNSSNKKVDYSGVIKPIKDNIRTTTVYPKDGGRYKIVSNAYDEEPGFLNGFETVEKNAIAEVTHKVLLNEIDKEDANGGSSADSFSLIYNDINKKYDMCYYKMIMDKVFCPSIKEIHDFFYVNDISIHTTPTLEAYEADESKDNNKLSSKDYVRYWLRTPETLGDSISRVYVIFSHKNTKKDDYSITGSSAAESINKKKSDLYDQAIGVRPALYLKDGLNFSGKGTIDNPYTLIFKQTVNQPSNWAMSEVQEAIKNQLTTERVTSDYQGYITREEFCEIVMKLYDAFGGKTITNTANPFNDTNNTEIVRAYQAGIVGGTSEVSFSPNNNLTREQLCVMLIRALDAAEVNYSKKVGYQQNYPDENILSNWANDAVRILNGYGIFNGTDKGLDPKGTVTKEVAIVLLKRTYDKFK